MVGLLIRSCQGGGGRFINDKCIPSNLNPVNLHLKIKPWQFYKIIKLFIYPKN